MKRGVTQVVVDDNFRNGDRLSSWCDCHGAWHSGTVDEAWRRFASFVKRGHCPSCEGDC